MKVILFQDESEFIRNERFSDFFTSVNRYSNVDFRLPQIWYCGFFRILKSNIHKWLESYDIIEYKLMRIRMHENLIEWYIDIPNVEIAVLFKLTWL